MDYLKEIKELRERIPIPIKEAFRLLKKHEGNVTITEQEFRDKAASIEKQFKEDAIHTIIAQTGCSRAEAEEAYTDCKLDAPRAISYLKEKEYDRQYIPSASITKEGLAIFHQWLMYENYEGFNNVLDFEFDTITGILSHIPELQVVEQAIRIARQRKEFIFEDMPENTDIEEYVLYSNRFKKDPIYEQCEQILADNLSRLTTILGRHWRNLDKQSHPADD